MRSQVVRRDDGEIGQRDQAFLGAGMRVTRVVEAGMEIHAVVHQPGGGQEGGQGKPVRMLHHMHGLADVGSLPQRQLPSSQRIQGTFRGGALIHTVGPRQVEEHLEQRQIRIQPLEFKAGLRRIHEIDADIKDPTAGPRQGQGQLLRPLVTEVPVDDPEEDPILLCVRQGGHVVRLPVFSSSCARRHLHRQQGGGLHPMDRQPTAQPPPAHMADAVAQARGQGQPKVQLPQELVQESQTAAVTTISTRH